MRTAGALSALGIVLGAVGCSSDADEQWELSHYRIIAIRATPPGIASGEQSEIDGLLGDVDRAPFEEVPEQVVVVSPQSLADSLARDGDRWVVTAPDEAALAAARAELSLDVGAPVPLQLAVAYDGGDLAGLKIVRLGVHEDNPTLAGITVDGATPGAALTAPRVEHVELHVDATDTDDVNWLTSLGEMHDFDLPNGYLVVPVDDPDDDTDDDTTGDLGVVLRTETGGVAWQFWPISVE